MAEPQQIRRRGCLFYVLLVGVISVIVLVIGGFFGLRYARSLVDKLTDTQPMTLPTVKLPEEQMFQLRDRVTTFRESVRDGDATEPLELTADELNALIETDPSLNALKNHLFVTINSNQLSSLVSFRAEDLGLVRLQGRYINADGIFNVGITNQELNIIAEALTVKGQPLPRNIMREITAQNLAEKLNSDPRAAAGLKKLQSVEVKDGKLVITPKK